MRYLQQTAVALCFLAWSGLSQAQSNYLFTPLGDQFSSDAVAINNLGQVVGVSDNGGFFTQSAMLWQGGQSIYLGAVSGNRVSIAYDINDHGQIVGYSVDDVRGNNKQATLWYQGSITALSSEGQTESVARAINNDGLIVGYQAANFSNAYKATRWDAATAQNLGNYSETSALQSFYLALGVNGSGQVVGTATEFVISGTVAHATLWSGSATDLGTLGGKDSYALAINDQGTSVGWSTIGASGYTHAVVWDSQGIHALGTLNPQEFSQATSINNEGDIVGFVYPNGLAGSSYAALWREGKTINLNSYLDDATRDAGWVLDSASDINDAGWIVGAAHNPLLGIGRRAYMLSIPAVPEPNEALLMGVGLAFLCLARKRVVFS